MPTYTKPCPFRFAAGTNSHRAHLSTSRHDQTNVSFLFVCFRCGSWHDERSGHLNDRAIFQEKKRACRDYSGLCQWLRYSHHVRLYQDLNQVSFFIENKFYFPSIFIETQRSLSISNRNPRDELKAIIKSQQKFGRFSNIFF